MSSATDEQTKDRLGAGGKCEPNGKRPNPVELEVPVSVAGARPATAQDKRELFTEETTTVLVFKDGAVIQLSAAIAVGQLLFLTDKRTKKEVVCQVVHKRSHRPTTCFVEVEFTEDVKNFWGVSFPEPGETEERPKTAEVVEAEETIEDDRNEPPEAPTTGDVTQLKEEVEALRAQLRELNEKHANEADDRDAQARRLAEAELAARAAAESEAKDHAGEMERKALANAARLAEEARQKLAQSQAQVPNRPEAAVPAREEEEPKRRLADPGVARAADEAEAQQRTWAQEHEEEVRKAAEAARKWELESVENERKRKEEEKARQERAEADRANPELKQETEEPAEAPARAPKIAMKLPSAAAWAPAVTPPTPAPMPVAASKKKEEIDPLEELLPKPALDFSKAPKGLDPNDPYNIYKPLRRKAGWQEIVVAAVIVVVLVGCGGYAWYRNWLPFLYRGPKLGAVKPAPTARPPAAPVAPNILRSGTTALAVNSANRQPGDNAPATRAATNGMNDAPAESAEETATAAKSGASALAREEKAPEKKASESKGSAKKEAEAKGARGNGGKNHGKAETSSESKPKPEGVVVAEDAPVIPAKLLHSAEPVYPPDAMRNYITGDVRIEAVVDAAGRVGAMQVLLGPAAFRQAAMDALSQYEYAPATQGGKAVASKVTVTIKFWFDP